LNILSVEVDKEYSTIIPLHYEVPDEFQYDKKKEDFIQRFRVKDEFRKAKGADLGIENAAIAEMISKLYS
jgi:hypothetical protein